MRRLTSWLLASLTFVPLGLGAGIQLALVSAPVPPLLLGTGAGGLALLLVLRNLPVRVALPIVPLTIVGVVAALPGGIAYFQFAIKPKMGHGLHEPRVRADIGGGDR